MKKISYHLTISEKTDFNYKMFVMKNDLKKISFYNKLKDTFLNKKYLYYKNILVCGNLIGSEIILGNLKRESFKITLLFSNKNCRIGNNVNQILIIYHRSDYKELFKTLIKLKTIKTENIIKKIINDIKKKENCCERINRKS